MSDLEIKESVRAYRFRVLFVDFIREQESNVRSPNETDPGHLSSEIRRPANLQENLPMKGTVDFSGLHWNAFLDLRDGPIITGIADLP
jgi:hypothetical protein